MASTYYTSTAYIKINNLSYIVLRLITTNKNILSTPAWHLGTLSIFYISHQRQISYYDCLVYALDPSFHLTHARSTSWKSSSNPSAESLCLQLNSQAWSPDLLDQPPRSERRNINPQVRREPFRACRWSSLSTQVFDI